MNRLPAPVCGRPRLIFALAFAVLTLPVDVHAQTKTVALPVKNGVADLNATIKGNQILQYSVKGSKGQNVEMSLTSKRAGSLVLRLFPAGSPTGADVLSNYISGETSLSGQLPADGEYVVFLGLQRAQARRGTAIPFQLHIKLSGK